MYTIRRRLYMFLSILFFIYTIDPIFLLHLAETYLKMLKNFKSSPHFFVVMYICMIIYKTKVNKLLRCFCGEQK